jgi:hypothetical protein
MPTPSEIRAQVASEAHRRGRLAVPAFAGGVLYLLSSIVISSTLSSAPTVGIVEGLEPALRGEANPNVSPRTDEVKFISHHAGPLIAGSVLAAIAVAALTLILLLLLDATEFRRPKVWAMSRPLVIGGGVGLAVVSVVHQLVSAIQTHKFAVGHDFTSHAVDQALTKGTLNVLVQYLDLLAGLALAAGMISTMLNSQRVGLLPKWMGLLGMFTALLIFLPIGGAELQIVPAFWMVMTGILLVGKWPGQDPPAWQAGEARPWPTPQRGRGPRPATAAAAAGAGGAVEPARPSGGSRSARRRAKRKGRGGRA